MMMRNVIISTLSLLFVMSGITTNAQQDIRMQSQQKKVDIDVSDKELQNFVDASSEIQKLQQEARGTMMKSMKDNGLSMKRYSEIQKKKSSGQKVDMSKKEQKAFDATKKSIRQEQMKIQKKAGEILKKHGIKRQRYMKISRAIRQDKALQQRFSKMRNTGK